MRYQRSLVPVILALLLLPGAAGSAQEGGNGVFVPFVTKLEGEVKNNLLRLTWTDSPDVRGPVFIYRSRVPIEGTNPGARTRPIEVPYGAQSYIDEPEGSGVFYYFIAASDEGGQKYEIFIPFNNIIAVTVAEERPGSPSAGTAPAGGPPSAGPETGTGEPPPVSSIAARIEGNGVLVTFTAAREAAGLILYRSVRPLRQFSDLLQAVIVQSGLGSPFTDYPVPGIPYYYAVLREADLTGGTVELSPGRNATISPVEVPPGKDRVGLPGSKTLIRAMPLPLISVQGAVPGSDAFLESPLPGTLDPEVAKALGKFLPAPSGEGGTKAPAKKPRAFNQDLEIPAGGEEYTIRSIVQGPFVKREWDAGKDALTRFLSLPRTRTVEARARFYLGQVCYFLGEYRESLLEFLRIEQEYPGEAKEWIQAVLAAMIN
ncbi:MAG: tetratricopeptide repeat protein [Treponema sp.]|jgi:hypothetical protein|nr:tetratricopeptide repeat protein [Treponema sp.]